MNIQIRSTTIIGVRNKGKVAMAGDGQVTFGEMAFKHKAVKVREFNIAHSKVLGGFAGAAADALTLFEKFENKLEQYEGDIKRAIFYESEYIVQNHNFENGQIIKEKNSFKITCNDGYLLIKNLKIEGKKRMNTSSFLNGFNIENYKMVK